MGEASSSAQSRGLLQCLFLSLGVQEETEQLKCVKSSNPSQGGAWRFHVGQARSTAGLCLTSPGSRDLSIDTGKRQWKKEDPLV